LEAALNAGAEYIVFADSDDAYLPDAFQEMITLLEMKPEIDCVIMDYVEAEQFDFTDIADPKDYFVVIFNNVYKYYQLHSRTDIVWYTIWGKMFRRRILEDVRFIPNLHPDEDLLFMIETFRTAQKFLISNKQAYFYRTNPEGVMNKNKKMPQYKNFITIANWSNEYFNESCCYDKVAMAVSHYAIGRIWRACTPDAVEVLKCFIKSKLYKSSDFIAQKARKLWKYRILNIITCGSISSFRSKLKIAKILAEKTHKDMKELGYAEKKVTRIIQ
jgi:glycosyltransferase involved in cell wall biosynthesis